MMKPAAMNTRCPAQLAATFQARRSRPVRSAGDVMASGRARLVDTTIRFEVVRALRRLVLRMELRHRVALVRLAEALERADLLIRKAWMPEIQEQDDPDLVAVVPHLVLERVVEHHHLALFPGALVGADADVAAV